MSKRLVFGVGINNADYKQEERIRWKTEDGINKSKLLWQCPYHLKWHNILQRCYSPAYHKLKETYRDCYICDEWKLFSNFKAWMELQDWENKVLDKDLLIENNKEYSPDTCIFISRDLNTFLTLSDKTRGNYPIGVNYYRWNNSFRAGICYKGKSKSLGYFSTPEEAHLQWQKAKLDRVIEFIDDTTEDRVLFGLNRIKLKLEHDIKYGLETKDL
jgi:hypothetical protein